MKQKQLEKRLESNNEPENLRRLSSRAGKQAENIKIARAKGEVEVDKYSTSFYIFFLFSLPCSL